MVGRFCERKMVCTYAEADFTRMLRMQRIQKKPGAAVSAPGGERNLEEGLSMIPYLTTIITSPFHKSFKNCSANAEKTPFTSPTP